LDILFCLTLYLSLLQSDYRLTNLDRQSYGLGAVDLDDVARRRDRGWRIEVETDVTVKIAVRQRVVHADTHEDVSCHPRRRRK